MKISCREHFRRWVTATIVAGALAVAPGAFAVVIYDNIPSPLPPNIDSWAYEVNTTRELGDRILFAPGPRNVTEVTWIMSNWATKSQYDPLGVSTGYTHSLTLSLYNVGPGNSVGSVIGSSTVTPFIPWRPEPSTACAGGEYQAADGQCYNGVAIPVTTNFAGLLVPNSIIYGLEYLTQDDGLPPGPYNSLNFGFGNNPPAIGSDADFDEAYMNNSDAFWYADGGAGGTGTFRQDFEWDGLTGAIQFNAVAAAVPEPGSLALLGIGLAAFGFARRRRK